MTWDLQYGNFSGFLFSEERDRTQLEPQPLLQEIETLLHARPGEAEQELAASWSAYRDNLCRLGSVCSPSEVEELVLKPLAERLGYGSMAHQELVVTVVGPRDGGWLLQDEESGGQLRCWSVDRGIDLDVPRTRDGVVAGSPQNSALNVLLATGERAGLLTNGDELRFLVSDADHGASTIQIRLDEGDGWRDADEPPASYRLMLALASPQGIASTLPRLIDLARHDLARHTSVRARRARHGLETFLQELLDHPQNRKALAAIHDHRELARQLWSEGLTTVFRILVVLEIETSPDPARAFTFVSKPAWRESYSPATALMRYVPAALQEDPTAGTGTLIEGGLRALFKMLTEGFSAGDLEIAPLGGSLFAPDATPFIDSLCWGERGAALLLDGFLPEREAEAGSSDRAEDRSRGERTEVRGQSASGTSQSSGACRAGPLYRSIDVEDLAAVFEGLLELEPRIAMEPMCRLRKEIEHDTLEVVVPLEKGAHYRGVMPAGDGGGGNGAADEDAGRPTGRRGTFAWHEEIPEGRFFLCRAPDRPSSPHRDGASRSIARFLVRETLTPLIESKSPDRNPMPAAILALDVFDPAMGSGRYLVEACRFLADAFLHACRLCGELARQAEEGAGKEQDRQKAQELTARAHVLRKRVEDLPVTDMELASVLAGGAGAGTGAGLGRALSWRRAETLARRLVAERCLFGADRNPDAVKLAKLLLWLESYTSGQPLVAFDHRLVAGDALTGPLLEDLSTLPTSGEPVEHDLVAGLNKKLEDLLGGILVRRKAFDGTVAVKASGARSGGAANGRQQADPKSKRGRKGRSAATSAKGLDEELGAIEHLATAWSGGVILDEEIVDEAFEEFLSAVIAGEDLEGVLEVYPELFDMIELGQPGLLFDLIYPEVFHRDGALESTGGFDAVIGDPPWEVLRAYKEEILATYDPAVVDTGASRGRGAIIRRLQRDPSIEAAVEDHLQSVHGAETLLDRFYTGVRRRANARPGKAGIELWQVFAERGLTLLAEQGIAGFLLPAGFADQSGAAGMRKLYTTESKLLSCFVLDDRVASERSGAASSFLACAIVVARRDAAGTQACERALELCSPEAFWVAGEPPGRKLRLSKRAGREFVVADTSEQEPPSTTESGCPTTQSLFPSS